MSSKPKKPAEEGNKGPPGWIVSFSDMVTLLLAFFVLLQTFAHTQDPELFYAGQGSFQRAVSGLGMSAWFGGQMPKPLRDYRKLKYPVSSDTDEHSRRRLINAKDEEIRRLLRDIKESMDAKADDVAKDSLETFSLQIRFDSSPTELDEEGKERLMRLAHLLKETVRRQDAIVYVIGMAADERSERARAKVSALRAQAVTAYLTPLLADGGDAWNVYSWGAGDGGPRVRRLGLSGRRPHVAVAIMSLSH